MKNKNSIVSTKVKVMCLCHPNVSSTTSTRRNKNLIRILESFVILPAITVAMPFGGLLGVMNVNTNNIDTKPQVASLEEQHIGFTRLFAFNQDQDEDAIDPLIEKETEAIDEYFRLRKLPLEGYGLKMAKEADKYGLDYRLIPAIAMAETTGGKHLCENPKGSFNPFGWGSCKIGFKSFDEAIEVIARNLSGNNPNTAHHYDGKTTKQILEKYNPPSVVPGYANKVIKIMNTIGKEKLEIEPVLTKISNTNT